MEKAKKLAEEHWSYIEGVLKAHGINESIIALVKFHYISAFIHGWKHKTEENIY
jgi:hypothetical protein